MQVEWIKNLHALRVGRENSSSWKESPGLKFCNTGILCSTLGQCIELCFPIQTFTLCDTLPDWKKGQKEQGGLISCEGEGPAQIASSNTFLSQG